MTQKLTDMHLVLLASACQREDGSLLPPPSSLGDQAARIRRAVTALIKRTLASELDITDAAKTWREDKGRHIGVVITDAGRAMIAAEEGGAQVGKAELAAAEAAGEDEGSGASAEAGPPDAPAIDPQPEPEVGVAPTATGARAGTKQALVTDMLRRKGGATLDELVAATSWLPHTTRAVLTGLRKKGHVINRTKHDDVICYAIAEAA